MALLEGEMERLTKERTEVREQQRKLETDLARLERAASYADEVEALSKRLSVGLDTMEFTQRRELVRLLVDEVQYDNGQVTVKTMLPLQQWHPVDRELERG